MTSTYAPNGTMGRIVSSAVRIDRLDTGVVQQIRERANNDGSREYEYYIHYIDCNGCEMGCVIDR